MDARTTIPLGDPALFRQQCYVNGDWMDADSGEAIEVDNPATREIIGTSLPLAGRRRGPRSRPPTRRGAGGARARRRSAPGCCAAGSSC